MATHPHLQVPRPPKPGAELTLQDGWDGPVWRWPVPHPDMRRCLSPVRFHREDPQPLEEDETQLPPSGQEILSLGRPAVPSWLEGSYRPRALTAVGVQALEQLGPGSEGLRGFPREPVATLAERRDLLAARYVAWDMVARGDAVEAGGVYHHRSPTMPSLEALAFRARWAFLSSSYHMDEKELLTWLGIFRLSTLDQLLTMDPENARNNHALLVELRDKDLVSTVRVPMGEGSLEVWQLTPRGWRYIARTYPEMRPRGMGPLHPLSADEPAILSSCATGRHALHALLQVDAIQWFEHMIRAQGGQITNLYLERALMREGGNRQGERFLDFRVAYELAHRAAGSFDVEVVGTGHSYRCRTRQDYIRNCAAHGSFSGASSRIELGRHVCIGR